MPLTGPPPTLYPDGARLLSELTERKAQFGLLKCQSFAGDFTRYKEFR